MGFPLSVAFLFSNGRFVFDVTWMLKPPLLAFAFDATGLGNWLRCNGEGRTPLRRISGCFRHDGEGLPSLFAFLFVFADCLPFGRALRVCF